MVRMKIGEVIVKEKFDYNCSVLWLGLTKTHSRSDYDLFFCTDVNEMHPKYLLMLFKKGWDYQVETNRNGVYVRFYKMLHTRSAIEKFLRDNRVILNYKKTKWLDKNKVWRLSIIDNINSKLHTDEIIESL